MSARTLLLSVVLLTLGCPAEVDEGDPPPIPKGGDTGDTAAVCSGTPPVITSLSAYADGLHELEQGQSYPTMIFEIQADDDDGDLNFVTYQAWWDDDMDGTVDTSGSAKITGQATISSTRCASFTMDLDLSLASQGDPAYNVWYDFAVVIGDEAGLLSEPAYVQGAMPKEDGSDPDPYE